MPASLELVKIALQAYGNGDSEIVIALAGPQVRWDERASRPDGDLVWGHDKVQRAMRRYLDSWDTYRFQLEDLAEVAPGKVVGICRERGKPKDGPAIDRRFGGLWVVEKGKIVSWTTYLTPREAVRAAKELAGPQAKPVESKPVAPPVSVAPVQPAPVPAAVPERAASQPPEQQPEPEPVPEPVREPEPVPETQAPAPFDFDEADAEQPAAGERPRKRILTKSEEQKRAARARAKLRRSNRQSA